MQKIYYILVSLILVFSGWSVVVAQVQQPEIASERNEAVALSDSVKLAPSSDIAPTEGMLQNVDQQLNGWYMKQYMQIDSTAAAGTNPVFTREQYMDRLRRLPNLIEMPYNDIVQQYIDQYTGRLRRTVSFMLGAQNFYIPLFEEALEAAGVPLELKYLPVVESAFDPMATSPVGAAGLWQFMVPTAKRYDLTVNSLLDERRDPVKSSRAAAAYLKDLYDSFGDWTLAIAAYNCGSTNVRKAIRRAGGARDYWTIYPYLPRETRGYVPAFIAANYVMTYYCDHNIPPMKTIAPIETDTIVVNREVHLGQVAGACNVDVQAVLAMNPQYRTGWVPGYSQPCAIRLPVQAIDKFLQLGDSVYNYRADEFTVRREEVVPTEMPDRVGAKEARRAAQRQEVAATAVAPSRRKSKRERAAERRAHKTRSRSRQSSSVSVRSGDTLSEIARRNGTTVAKLRKINKISGSNIRSGSKIRVR